MKVTKEQSAANRAALVRAAGRLFKEHGIDGVGVADVSKAAGLTHGALYAQFASKDELAAAALAASLERSNAKLHGGEDAAARSATRFVEDYLTRKHRDDLVGGCPVAASASEIARRDPAVGEALAEGVRRRVAAFEEALRREGRPRARELALTMVAAEFGALVLARDIAKADDELSDAFLGSTRRVLGKLARGSETART